MHRTDTPPRCNRKQQPGGICLRALPAHRPQPALLPASHAAPMEPDAVFACAFTRMDPAPAATNVGTGCNADLFFGIGRPETF